jgi:hypothetical protein
LLLGGDQQRSEFSAARFENPQRVGRHPFCSTVGLSAPVARRPYLLTACVAHREDPAGSPISREAAELGCLRMRDWPWSEQAPSWFESGESYGAEGRTRTDTGIAPHRFLRPARLPVPPLRLWVHSIIVRFACQFRHAEREPCCPGCCGHRA